ncbi:MAG: hypothetical protein CFE28_12765 [Alphaproteobacteria bacterium PA2]|nr:MAG: hypothetical protein CFE28_12765 [Alphaproteobacteria bacterium PA2]
MVMLAAKYLIWLGLVHIGFGLTRYRGILLAALREGFTGRFAESDERRAAFWFLMAGPLTSLTGLGAVAAARGDQGLILTMGICLLLTCGVGVLAFPKSPLWTILPPALIFIAGGLGFVS